MNLPTEEQVRAALTEVNDPEIGVNIVDLLRHEWVVLTEAAARKLEEVLDL